MNHRSVFCLEFAAAVRETATVDAGTATAAGTIFNDSLLGGAVGENILTDINVGAVIRNIFCGIFAAARRLHLGAEDEIRIFNSYNIRLYYKLYYI